MVCGYVLGIGLAAMRLSGNRVLRTLSFGYVWLVRSVPPLVQLLFWYEFASLYPRLSLGIPFGPEFVTVEDRAPVHRHARRVRRPHPRRRRVLVRDRARRHPVGRARPVGGGRRRSDSAGARIFRRIVLPQAMPAIIPASGNLLIGMLKATSIVSVIAVQDLLYSVQLIYNQNFLIMPLLMVATIWYVILTTRAVDRPVLRRAVLRPRAAATRTAADVLADHPGEPAGVPARDAA